MKTAWICAPTFPEIERDAGSRRIMYTARILEELGFRVSLVTPSCGSAKSARILEGSSVELIVGSPPVVLESTPRPDPDLIVICHWYLAETWIRHIRRALPETKIVIDNMDLHFLRQTRKSFQRNGEQPAILDPETGFVYVRELNTYAAADAVWTVSEKEAALVNSFLGSRTLAAAIPDCEEMPPSNLPFDARKGVLFIGNFRHDPNRSGVEYLCRQIVPLLDRKLLREHPVMVVGNALDADIRRLGEDLEGVQMIGWVPSIIQYLQHCRASVLPLLYGAGTKRKLVQSLMSRTPAVSTWVGIEGLDLRPGKDVLVADDPQEFAQCIERLLVDADLWIALARRGRTRVLRNHSRHVIRERIRSEVGRLLRLTPKSGDLAVAADVLKTNWLKPQYQQLLLRINHAVLDHTSENSTLLVVSKGDEQLLQFPKRHASHFPSDDQGNYTGYNPPDSEWCIRKLQSAAAAHPTVFVLPAPFLWWLEYYRGLREYLFARCRVAYDDAETCVIFELANDTSFSRGT